MAVLQPFKSAVLLAMRAAKSTNTVTARAEKRETERLYMKRET